MFQVDFYGFDEGDLVADVTFESHPPTGPVQELLTDEVAIGEDDNAGGSQAGLDASATYTLDFAGIQPHPNQGFHVKLTVHADGSQGADTKYKVFWVAGCAAGTTTTTTRGGGSSGTTTTRTTTTTRAGGRDTTTTTSASSGSASSGPGSSTGASASSATGGGGLPLTGASAAPLLAAGLALLGLGAAALLRSRQRRT